MISFEAGKEFLVATAAPYRLGQLIHAPGGLRGKVIDQISEQDYNDVWAFRGYPAEGESVDPRYFYRCEKLETYPRSAVVSML